MRMWPADDNPWSCFSSTFRWVLEVGRLVQRVPLPVEPSTASYPFFFETGSLFDLELVK